MLKEVDWPYLREYRSGTDFDPLEFYMNAFSHSKKVDLLLGYFSFSAINVLALGFSKFLLNGGEMRIIANNLLSKSDKETIERSRSTSTQSSLINLEDVRLLRSQLDEYGTHFFECIAWLIANKRIEIVLVKPKDSKGITHFKSGVFYDDENSVRFKASCNFTAYGMLENLEELDVFLNWENSRSSKVIQSQEEYFESIFSGKSQLVDYVPIDKVEVILKKEFGKRDLNELITNERELIKLKLAREPSKRLKRLAQKLDTELERLSRIPRFPYPEGPRKYQKEALTKWIENGKTGVFAMATGTGKTLTSLNCLLHEYQESGKYKAVIVVPTIALVGQWKDECRKFNFQNIITVSSKTKWGADISFFNTASKFIDTSFIVIITYASFHRKKFQEHFKELPSESVFIADEAHNLGAGKVAATLKDIHLTKRIGLSATISRKYDEEGNQAIQEFFDDRPPYVINYTMEMALDKGWLCPYQYIPHLVELETDEFEEYINISRKLMRHFDSATGTYKKNSAVEMLLLARKRIIHKARAKLPIFQDILKKEFKKRKSLKYTLVYVPEGTNPDVDASDQWDESDEDQKLIAAYSKAVADVNSSVMVKQYTSKSHNREELLNRFENGELHVLTSMKCLDEGVDVPRSELAIFCASTGNPRQFIQRRGRVLRLHEAKTLATIHDLVVVPKVGQSEGFFDMEKNLVRKELERVVDFAFLANNKMLTFDVFAEVLDYYNLNLFEIQDQNNQTS